MLRLNRNANQQQPNNGDVVGQKVDLELEELRNHDLFDFLYEDMAPDTGKQMARKQADLTATFRDCLEACKDKLISSSTIMTLLSDVLRVIQHLLSQIAQNNTIQIPTVSLDRVVSLLFQLNAQFAVLGTASRLGIILLTLPRVFVKSSELQLKPKVMVQYTAQLHHDIPLPGEY
ncbi:hypothetical protein MIR68_009408 [Amoeboaphelidium protococcarum]|nr:hypothetical protein MIR68_009408 [Amoeboaphelidium protococcarum]